MIVLPTFAGLKAIYNVLDLKITKKKKGSGRKEGRKVGEGYGCPRLRVLSPSPPGGIGGGWRGLSYCLPITI